MRDCSNPSNFNCATGTLAQAEAAGAIKPTATVGDLDVGDFLHSVTISSCSRPSSARRAPTRTSPTSAISSGCSSATPTCSGSRSRRTCWPSSTRTGRAMSMTAGFSVQGSGTRVGRREDRPSGRLRLRSGLGFADGEREFRSGPGRPDDHQHHERARRSSGTSTPSTPTRPTRSASTCTAARRSARRRRPRPSPREATRARASARSRSPTASRTALPRPRPRSTRAPGTTRSRCRRCPRPARSTTTRSRCRPRARASRCTSRTCRRLRPRALLGASTSVRTTTNLAPPLQDGVVPDTQVNLNDGSSGQLTPTGLEDVPDPGIPLVQLSDNRHHGRRGRRHGLAGRRRLHHDRGVRLQRRVQPAGVHAAGEGDRAAGDRDLRRAHASRTATGRRSTRCPTCSNSLPANLNTIILVDEQRLGDTYGRPDETTAGRAKPRHSTSPATPTLGVSGVVVPVETISGRPVPLQRVGREPVRPRLGERDRERDRRRGRPDRGRAAERQVRRLRRRRRPDPVLPPARPVADRERERLRRPVRARTSTRARSPPAIC